MVKIIKNIGLCLLCIIALPFAIVLSIPLGIYAFINYIIGVINTFKGKKPSIVTEFDQVPVDNTLMQASPITGDNPYSMYMEQSQVNSNNVSNSNNTINSNNISNSNNTTTTNNYIFTNTNPFQVQQNLDQVQSLNKNEEDIVTFTPEDKKLESPETPKVITADVKELPLKDYRELANKNQISQSHPDPTNEKGGN